MTMFVSYVPDETIEKDAQALLAEYAQARGVSIETPIPIEDIVEKHLKIGIEFDDMHRRLGVPRALASTSTPTFSARSTSTRNGS